MLRYKVAPTLNVTSNLELGGKLDKDDVHGTFVTLGRVSEQGMPPVVKIVLARETVLGIFGQRGSGKSYTMGTFLEGLSIKTAQMEVGGNQGDRAVLVLDTLNIFQYLSIGVTDVADSTLKTLFSSKFNLFGVKEAELLVDVSFPAGYKQAFYPETYAEFAIDTSVIAPEDYAHLFEIDIYKDAMGHALQAAHDAVKNSGYVSRGIQCPGTNSAGIRELIDCLAEPVNLGGSFDPNTIRALLARLQSLAREPLFASSPTDIASLVRGGRVRVLLLNHLPPPMRSLIAAILTRQLFNARARAAEASKALKLNKSLSAEMKRECERTLSAAPPKTLLCIDEAQGYAPPTKANPSTSVLIQFVKEGRNHGLSLLLASQQPSAIHPEVMSQLDCIIAHRLSVSSDIEAVLRNAKGRSPQKISVGATDISEQDLLRELDQGQAYVSHPDAARSFVLEVRPRITAHGGIEG